MNLKFSELQLEPRLYSAIEKLGYQDCTPVQSAVIPHILAGRDVSGLAQTGTGKTAAFLIPLMDRILKGQFQDWKIGQFILILVPTRELAEQVYENVYKLSEFSGLKGISVYGGTSYDKQKEGFRNNVEFVVATPGRLIDLYKEHFVDLKQVRAIVFDEADRMFDMGFKDDMKYILQRVPKERQFLVFSATLNFDVLNTAYQFGAEPVEINVSRDQPKAENVKDEIFHVGHEDKPKYLLSLLKKHNPKQTIIFSNFKHNVERIARFLTANGWPAMEISSLLTQAQRNKVLELFKADNEKNILVATDVAARGLDIKGVDLVINFELPNDAESYVHRIGRTGRAGAEGQAFSLVCDRDVDSLARVEEYLKHKVNVGWMEDTEMPTDFKPFPSEDRRPRGGDRNDNRSGGRPSFQGGNGGGRPARGGDRGDRPQRNHDRPRPSGDGDRKQGGSRPDNREGRPERRPLADNPNHPDLRKPRHERGTPTPQAASGAQANGGGRKPDQRQGNGSHRNDKRGGPRRPQQSHGSRQHGGKAAMAKPSPLQKVTGFFKKLFT